MLLLIIIQLLLLTFNSIIKIILTQHTMENVRNISWESGGMAMYISGFFIWEIKCTKPKILICPTKKLCYSPEIV